MGLLKAAKAHVGATAALAVVVLGGAGVATAAVVVSPASTSDEVFDAPEATTPAATTTPETVTPVEPVTPPVSAEVEAPADTVEPVTEPAPTVVAEPVVPAIPEGHRLPDAPAGQDMSGVGTIGPDGRYYSQQTGVDGLPTYVPDSGATAEPLPGEPGYELPAN